MIEKTEVEQLKPVRIYKNVDIHSKEFPKFYLEAIEKDIFFAFYYLPSHAFNIMLLLHTIKKPITKIKLIYNSTGTTASYTSICIKLLESVNFIMVDKDTSKRNAMIIMTEFGKAKMKVFFDSIKELNM